MRKNTRGSIEALARARAHLGKAVAAVKQARSELVHVRQPGRREPARVQVLDEGLRFLREEMRALSEWCEAPLGLSLRSETPEMDDSEPKTLGDVFGKVVDGAQTNLEKIAVYAEAAEKKSDVEVLVDKGVITEVKLVEAKPHVHTFVGNRCACGEFE